MSKAQNATAAGEVLRAAVAEYGYDNLSLSRTHRGVTLDVPWNWMPSAFAEAYFTQGWEKHDPELFYARHTQFPFHWDSAVQKVRLTSGQRRVYDASASFGLHNGLCVPLRGRDGHLDLISLCSSQKGNAVDPAHCNTVALLALRALARFLELDKESETTPLASRDRNSFYELDDLIDGQFAPFTLPPTHLRALAIVAIGAQRWRHGLTKLGSRIYLLRRNQPYEDLQRWGFVVDEPDDMRWRYYFTPSVLGLSYLRRSPDAEDICREFWLRDLDRYEVPDGLEAE